MATPVDNRLDRARDLLRAAREEFARAEEARGGDAVIGLRNACGKGWLAVLDAANAFFLNQGVAESELPENDRGRRYFTARFMDRDTRLAYNSLYCTFYSDGWGDGIVEFEEMPARFDELEEFINDIEAARG